MSSIVSLHNKKLLRPRNTEYGCNCRMKEKCPLQNQCLTLNLNRADVENNADKSTKIYFGLAETSFKAQFANHNNILYIYIYGVYIYIYIMFSLWCLYMRLFCQLKFEVMNLIMPCIMF